MARLSGKVIYVGIKGTLLALDRGTGAAVWKTALKGGDFVNVVLDGNDLFATTKGEVFCLDPANGQIRWNNPMKGSGFGLITIATAGATSTAALAEYVRRAEAAAAAATSTAG